MKVEVDRKWCMIIIQSPEHSVKKEILLSLRKISQRRHPGFHPSITLMKYHGAKLYFWRQRQGYGECL